MKDIVDSKLVAELVQQMSTLEHRGAVLSEMGPRPAAMALRAMEVSAVRSITSMLQHLSLFS
eukprot:1194636-Prorocentrum_minimum.AAC.2